MQRQNPIFTALKTYLDHGNKTIEGCHIALCTSQQGEFIIIQLPAPTQTLLLHLGHAHPVKFVPAEQHITCFKNLTESPGNSCFHHTWVGKQEDQNDEYRVHTHYNPHQFQHCFSPDVGTLTGIDRIRCEAFASEAISKVMAMVMQALQKQYGQAMLAYQGADKKAAELSKNIDSYEGIQTYLEALSASQTCLIALIGLSFDDYNLHAQMRLLRHTIKTQRAKLQPLQATPSQPTPETEAADSTKSSSAVVLTTLTYSKQTEQKHAQRREELTRELASLTAMSAQTLRRKRDVLDELIALFPEESSSREALEELLELAKQRDQISKQALTSMTMHIIRQPDREKAEFQALSDLYTAADSNEILRMFAFAIQKQQRAVIHYMCSHYRVILMHEDSLSKKINIKGTEKTLDDILKKADINLMNFTLLALMHRNIDELRKFILKATKDAIAFAKTQKINSADIDPLYIALTFRTIDAVAAILDSQTKATPNKKSKQEDQSTQQTSFNFTKLHYLEVCSMADDLDLDSQIYLLNLLKNHGFNPNHAKFDLLGLVCTPPLAVTSAQALLAVGADPMRTSFEYKLSDSKKVKVTLFERIARSQKNVKYDLHSVFKIFHASAEAFKTDPEHIKYIYSMIFKVYKIHYKDMTTDDKQRYIDFINQYFDLNQVVRADTGHTLLMAAIVFQDHDMLTILLAQETIELTRSHYIKEAEAKWGEYTPLQFAENFSTEPSVEQRIFDAMAKRGKSERTSAISPRRNLSPPGHRHQPTQTHHTEDQHAPSLHF